MNYIRPSELLLYYDQRRLLEMLSDTGTPVTTAGLDTNAIALTAVRQASSLIDSHVQTGQRYTRTQLEDIVTAANAGGASEEAKKRAEPVKSLAAHLAFGCIMSRRGYSAAKMADLAPMYAESLNQLNLLSSGIRILDLDQPKRAGVPTSVRIGDKTTSLTQYNMMFGVFGSDPTTFLFPGNT